MIQFFWGWGAKIFNIFFAGRGNENFSKIWGGYENNFSHHTHTACQQIFPENLRGTKIFSNFFLGGEGNKSTHCVLLSPFTPPPQKKFNCITQLNLNLKFQDHISIHPDDYVESSHD